MVDNFNISSILRQFRKSSDYVAKDVTEKLKQYGINISEKTLYGYESGISMPNANTFIALCLIYNCKNPLSAIKNQAEDPDEAVIIAKYRSLDDRGKSAVRNVLDHEYESLAGETACSVAKEA